MSLTILTPEDAAAIARVIEDHAAEQLSDRQTEVAMLVAHRLLTTGDGDVAIQTQVHPSIAEREAERKAERI